MVGGVRKTVGRGSIYELKINFKTSHLKFQEQQNHVKFANSSAQFAEGAVLLLNVAPSAQCP